MALALYTMINPIAKSVNVNNINIISGVVFFVGKRPHLEMQVIWPVKEAALMIQLLL